MGIKGVPFESAWRSRVNGSYGRARVSFLSVANLIRSKRDEGGQLGLLKVQHLTGNAPRSAGRRRPPRKPRNQ